jgi:hypothetical protein
LVGDFVNVPGDVKEVKVPPVYPTTGFCTGPIIPPLDIA